MFPLDRHEAPASGRAGWSGPIAAGVLAAVLRLPGLGRPHALVFDETYYAKDALSLLRYGYERKTVEGANELLLSGQSGIFTTEPSYVVHPPVGKWAIALGEQLFGATPFGWRIVVALLGIASVVMTARIARRLTRSNTVGTVAGLLLALDGVHIAISRTALLDMTLSFFVLAAFGVLIIDRDHRGTPGYRWTRPTLTVLLGLAIATKWSGVYFALVFGVLMLAWDLRRRQEHDGQTAIPTWLRRDVATAAFMPVGALVVYTATWVGWFRNTGAWGRDWDPGSASMRPLRQLLHYHEQMLSFHTHLTATHSYSANPWGWPLLLRPTSFFYESEPTCGTDNCSQEVIPLGNPIIWWLGALAIVMLAYFAVRRFHSAAAAIVAAAAAGWVPWLFFPSRTMFHFYSVVYIPYTVMALALLAVFVSSRASLHRDEWNWPLVGLLCAVSVLTMFFYPILTGMSLPYDQWQLRMWLPSWI